MDQTTCSSAEESGSSSAALRFPKEPYPGLRPFLDYESAILFGRDAQVQQIIAHLKLRNFVAVIGGSGAGKSSLVRAGVVPELRSYAIPGAGDYWISLVCTPGSSSWGAPAEDQQDTPIRRFAWKFSRLLRPPPPGQSVGERIDDIAGLLRRESGFARLLRKYGGDLLPRAGLASEEARLLIVIDQFEEVFHPTNKNDDGSMSGDAWLLVQRVIDHFFTPHPRCYLVLTMRSEHLNDCATFLELPDAINASFYLVRRLDTDQIAEAITGPARSYRLVREREERDGDKLPLDITFDRAVLDRLLRDVHAIEHDVDHLPLLQHLLSRTWDSALSRCGPHTLPEKIDMDDLARGVLARADACEANLSGVQNTLRYSLVAHADLVYQAHNAGEREAIDAMLKRLAFKDPNTGMYSQERIKITPDNRTELHALVQDGLIGNVNYLFWDPENPERETLKVSHESFIRGWPHFRVIIDQEAERFEQFVQLLRACLRWFEGHRIHRLLLEGAELRHMEAANLGHVLNEPAECERWGRLLAFVRDGVRLRRMEVVVDEFWKTSLAREQARLEASILEAQLLDDAKRQKELQAKRLAEADAQMQLDRTLAAEAAVKRALAEKRLAEAEVDQLRLRRAQVGWGMALFVVVPVALFFLIVQQPVAHRSKAYFDASRMMVNVATRGNSDTEAKRLLQEALKATTTLEGGRTGFYGRPLDSILRNFGSLPFFSAQKAYLAAATESLEPPVTASLLELLAGYPWPVSASSLNGGPQTLVTLSLNNKACARAASTESPSQKSRRSLNVPSNLAANTVVGKVYATALDASTDMAEVRAVLVTSEDNGKPSAVFAATLVGAAGTALPQMECLLDEQPFWTAPPYEFAPDVALTPDLKHIFTVTSSNASDVVTLEQILWSRSTERHHWVAARQVPTVLLDPQFAAAMREHGRTLLQGGTARYGLELDFGSGVRRQMVSASPWSLRDVKISENTPLKEVESGACVVLSAAVKDSTPGLFESSVRVFESGDHCFVETRSAAYDQAANGSTGVLLPTADTRSMRAKPNEHQIVMLGVYLKPPDGVPVQAPRALASLPFGSQPSGARDWTLIKGDLYGGWIALKSPKADNSLIGLPWTTEALARIGTSIEQRISADPNSSQKIISGDKR